MQGISFTGVVAFASSVGGFRDTANGGGLRVIYYWVVPDRIFKLLPLQKSAQENLTPSQLRTLRKLVKEWLQ